MQGFAHVILLFFVAGEDADFADVGVEEAVEDGVAEGAGAAGDEEGFVGEPGKIPRSVLNFSGQEKGQTYGQV
jgi:hypothetical protein